MVQDGDLGFCAGDAPISRIIERDTDSPWSHVLMLFHENDEIRTLESTFTEGVHVGNAGHYLQLSDGPFVVARLKGLTQGEALSFLGRGFHLIGRGYEVDEEIAMALHRLCKLVPVHPEYKELFCSGLIQDILRNSRYAVSNDADGGNATPEDVWRLPFLEPVCAVVTR